MSSPDIFSSFSVSSGALCFGSLHNIWQGSLVQIQPFPKVRPQQSGTVLAQQLEYNLSARNGTWNAYQLVDLRSKGVRAWFVAHSDVEPQREIAKILRVSGSPYESDTGSHMNDERTESESVLVINRYDWTYYDKRSWDEIGEGVEEGDADVLANSNSLGLVDFASAKDLVQKWKQQKPSQREAASSGMWLYIPHAEYMFGRFGFNERHEAAQSFLFFSAGTEFAQTTFSGMNMPLRVIESPQDRFERRLREGYDFSGVGAIQNLTSQGDQPGMKSLYAPAPPATQQRGPYDPSDHILQEQDIDALRLYPYSKQHFAMHGLEQPNSFDGSVPGFVEPWKTSLFDLVNEMALSYLERTFVPPVGRQGLPPATTLFPGYAKGNHQVDTHCYRHFTNPDQESIHGYDVTSMGTRIKTFLLSRSPQGVSFQDTEINGICRVIAYLLSEVFELAENNVEDEGQIGIFPINIRLAVLSDQELRDLLQSSHVFWNGRNSKHTTAGICWSSPTQLLIRPLRACL